MNSQDFVRTVDFTGINPITGADLNNLVDLTFPYDDGSSTGKSLNLVTKDTALNTPDVPNPNLSGLYNKWKRYLWIRVPHATATSRKPLVYAWNEDAASNATYLKWLETSVDITALQAQINAVEVTANNAYQTANTANGVAVAANALANTAKNTADTAKSSADTAISDAANAQGDADTAIANAATAQTQANAALNVASNPKAINSALLPGSSLQRPRTNSAADGTEWYNESNNYAHIIGRGTSYGLSAGWNVVTLNITDQNPGGIVTNLSGNKVTLGAGTYRFKAKTSSYDARISVLMLGNDTTSTVLGYGEVSQSTNTFRHTHHIVGQFTLAATSLISLYLYTSNGSALIGTATTASDAAISSGTGLTGAYGILVVPENLASLEIIKC